MVTAGGSGKMVGELLFHGDGVSDFKDENALEICFITLCMSSTLLNHQRKIVKMANFILMGFFFNHNEKNAIISPFLKKKKSLTFCSPLLCITSQGHACESIVYRRDHLLPSLPFSSQTSPVTPYSLQLKQCR